MRILVCGGRDFNDCSFVCDTLDQIHKTTPITALCTGGARGADEWAMEWWNWNQEVDLHTHLPNWGAYGKSAGAIRNLKMLEEFKPDLVIAFPGGKGTAHMVKISKEAGIDVREF